MKHFIFVCALAAATVASRNSTPSETTFLKLIKDRDLYTTPATLWLGYDNGTIVRCLLENTKIYEVFHQAGAGGFTSGISDLVISGEYLYVGVRYGEILRCNLDTKSCESYAQPGEIYSLAVGKGHLFVGHSTGVITICELNQKNSCKVLTWRGIVENAVSSLIQTDKYLYAGLLNGLIMRCTLEGNNQCVPVYNMSGYSQFYDSNPSVTGLVSFENSIYAGTGDGAFANCSRKIISGTNHCELLNLQYTSISDFAAYNDSLYLQKYGTTSIFDLRINDTRYKIVRYESVAHHRQAWRVAFTYKTYHMQGRYKDEHKVCKWQGDSRCSLVIYYDAQQRAAFEVQVKDGRLYNSHDSLVDTTHADRGHSGVAAIFVMGPDGRLLLSNQHSRGFIHTSSLLAGNPVSGAGEIIVENGIIKKILACSDHYKPDLELNTQVLQSLRTQGYMETVESRPCCEGDECD